MLAIFMTLANDEEKALAERLYMTYKNRMYGIAYSILHSREDAEDAVMEAVCKIVGNISRFSGASQSKTESLIVIITRNTAINLYRYNRRRAMTPLDKQHENIPCTDPTPAEMFGQAEDYEALLAAIRSLEPTYRDVLLMKYLYGFDNAAISSMTGVSETTVRVRLMRARAKLAETLGGEADGK
ncbi:MAG: RNA polymerase sigma factor [Eubacteriales bacterium]